jgi:hypothetical protein
MCVIARLETPWMSESPDNVRPLHLAERFPRIANRICALWKHPVRCSHYMAELLIVRRDAGNGTFIGYR